MFPKNYSTDLITGNETGLLPIIKLGQMSEITQNVHYKRANGFF